MRAWTTRATILTIALVAPAGVATGADATPPSDVPATTAPPSSDTAGPAGTDTSSNGSGEGGATSLRTADAEFAVDLLLGLLPQDELEAFWNEQEEQRQLAIQACMNEAGFEYNLENRADADPYADLTPLEYAEQWGFGVWTSMDPDSPMNAMTDDDAWPNEDIVMVLGASEQNAWYEVNAQCYEDASAESDAVYRNPMVLQALEDFSSDVENDPRVQAAVADWRECMEAAGFPFASEEDMYAQVYGQGEDTSELQSRLYESAAWDPASPDHPEWQALVDEEIGIAVANATCATAVQDARDAVTADLRAGLVEVWKTVDWDLPPVTYDDEGDDMVVIGEGSEAIGVVEEGAGASDAGADSTLPTTSTP